MDEDVVKDPKLLANLLEQIEQRQTALEQALQTVIATAAIGDAAALANMRTILLEKAEMMHESSAGRSLLIRIAS